MASVDAEFQQAMNDIFRLSPMLGLDDQPLVQMWTGKLARLVQVENKAVALEYANYLAYQLQRKQLRFPFSQQPPAGELCNLKDLLYGEETESSNLPVQTFAPEESQLSPARPSSSKLQSARGRDKNEDEAFADDVSKVSGGLIGGLDSLEYWNDSVRWSKTQRECREEEMSREWCDQSRQVLAELEDLPEEAPLWVLLSRACSLTRDGGALLHAVVAEELAEWSARLAADQTMANKNVITPGHDQIFEVYEDEEEAEWAPRSDRRVDHWNELWTAWRSLSKEDPSAAADLGAEILIWLNGNSSQLQTEHARWKALCDELQEIQSEIQQSYNSKESQYGTQNHSLSREVRALQDSVHENEKIIEALSGRHDDRGSVLAARKLSYSEESLEI